MANWASTDYVIEGTKKEIKLIFDTIDDFMKEKRPSMEGAAKNWEGNIINALKNKNEQIDLNKNYLRGFIQDYNLDDETLLRITAEEAWGATDFRHCLKNIFTDINVFFIVEEFGCEVYATNDADGKYFSSRFLIDYCIDGKDGIEYFYNEEDVLQYAAKKIKREKVTFDDINEWNEKQSEDLLENFIYIHKFEIVI